MMASKRLGSVSSFLTSGASGTTRKSSVVVSTDGRRRTRPPVSSDSAAINRPARAVDFRRSPRRRPATARSELRRSASRRSPLRGVGSRCDSIRPPFVHDSYFEHRPVGDPVNRSGPITGAVMPKWEGFSGVRVLLHKRLYDRRGAKVSDRKHLHSHPVGPHALARFSHPFASVGTRAKPAPSSFYLY